MHKLVKDPSNRIVLPPPIRPHPNAAGNVLIYVVVLMLIFGVLGVVMVSLFTSTTASTVSRNDSRRARYMAESGMRYAFSEMRKADFDMNVMINTLNTTTYKIGGTESFTINVFSPWMDSTKTQSSPSDGPLTLLVPIGAIPTGYIFPPNNIYAINYEFTGTTPTEPGGVAEISSVAGQTLTTLDLNLNQIFNAGEDERICFAVIPTQNQTITDGGNLYIAPEAAKIFPRFGGAFSIGRNEYFYEELIDDPDNNRVILRNLSRRPDADPNLPVTAADDWVILSPRNYLVVPTGTSDGNIYGGDYLFGKGIYDASLIRPGSRQPDITADDLTSSLSEQESGGGFFQANTVDDELTIGGGGSNEFGSAFFNADMSIGGDQDYCQQGACRLALGIRTFFLLDFTSQGDGITFTLTNAANNKETSAGGDGQLSELMGYAGDSRRIANPNPGDPSDWIATDPNNRGLDPPKIAVEFDTRTNEPEFNFCAGANLNSDTRNDPVPEGADNRDVLQYVFWAREMLDLVCRSGGDNSTYDDNRHNADDWQVDLNNDVRSTPAVGPDGTIYVGSNDNSVHAINPTARAAGLPFPDGPSGEWSFSTGGDVISSPIVDAGGTIYVGSNDNFFYAINPNGTQKWRFDTGADVRSSPAIGPDGTIYVGNDAGNVYAFDPTAPLPPKWVFDAFGDFISLGRPAIGSDGTVYVASDKIVLGDDEGELEAINPSTGLQKWTFDIGDKSDWAPGINPNTDTLYIDRSGNKIVAVLSTGVPEWEFDMGADVDSTPAVGPDGTIYFGTDDDDANNYWLYALTSDRVVKWRFQTGDEVDTSPALSSDGSIVYVVSNDNNLYAVNTADGEELWRFPIASPDGDNNTPVSSPTVGADGTVYVGSIDNNLYAIGRPAEPRNIRDLLITSTKDGVRDIVAGQEVDVNSEIDWLNGDASDQKRWAVRLEVDRIGADYTLSLWLRQCADLECTNILGTFFQDTRVDYDYSAVPDNLPMMQQFTLSDPFNLAFERFYFGFTGAAGAAALNATISQFQLSFIRPGDPVVTDDSTNWPP